MPRRCHFPIDFLQPKCPTCNDRPKDPAPTGSPYLGKGASLPSRYTPSADYEFPSACGDHTLGFAGMVEPATRFLLAALRATRG